MSNGYEIPIAKQVLHNAVQLLVDQCYSHAKSAGWWTDPETGEDVRNWPPKFLKLWIATKICLMHSELSEALEGHRKGKMDEHLSHRTSLEVELADAVIRICDLAGGLGLDLAGAIVEKGEYNMRRADHKMSARKAEGGKAF